MVFPPLAATRAEVEACAARLREATDEAPRMLLGDEASEAGLRDAAPGRGVVHFATHGFVRLDLAGGARSRRRSLDPMLLAGLALAGANVGRRGGDDGVLTALEAAELDLDGVELVVLSACDSANGSREAGEGVLGLVHGFRLAGAENVVASLWPVADEATRRLMERFYAAAYPPSGEGVAPAHALRAAALSLREDEEEVVVLGVDEAGRLGLAVGRVEYAAPFYWAPFVVHGPQRGGRPADPPAGGDDGERR